MNKMKKTHKKTNIIYSHTLKINNFFGKNKKNKQFGGGDVPDYQLPQQKKIESPSILQNLKLRNDSKRSTNVALLLKCQPFLKARLNNINILILIFQTSI